MSVFRDLRRSKSLSQVELAQLLEVDQTTVSKWEVGRALPETKMLIKLAEFYDVSTDFLLSRSEYYYPDRLKSNASSASAPALSHDEQEVLALYQSLSPTRQEDLKIYLRALSGNSAISTTKKKA